MTPLQGHNRLYGDLAWLWPLMSPPEHYAEEAGYWLRALRERLRIGRRRILELGCGGGHLLHHLVSEYDATAVDLSEGMLAHSRRLNPGVAHHVGDMRSVRLGQTFDAVLIHDAIDYMTTEDELRAVFATSRAYLRAGGLLIVAPDHYTGTLTSPSVDDDTNSDGETTLTYVDYSIDLDPTDTTVETTYVFFIDQDGELRVEVDRHTTGLFPVATWERLLTEAGFAWERVDYPVSEDGTPMWLWVCRMGGRRARGVLRQAQDERGAGGWPFDFPQGERGRGGPAFDFPQGERGRAVLRQAQDERGRAVRETPLRSESGRVAVVIPCGGAGGRRRRGCRRGWPAAAVQ